MVEIRSHHNCDIEILVCCPYCDNPMFTFEPVVIVRNSEQGPDEVMCLAHQDCHTDALSEDDDDDEDEGEE